MKDVFIIEGVDCSGKSTFLDFFIKNWGDGILIKNCYKPRTSETTQIKRQYFDIKNIIDKADSVGFNNFFIDRYYPSQLVYSIKRGKDDFEDEWFWRFDDLMSRTNKYRVHLILITEDVEEIKKRMKERGEEYIQENEVEMLQKRYLEFFDRSKLKKIKLKSLDGLKENYDKIVAWRKDLYG